MKFEVDRNADPPFEEATKEATFLVMDLEKYNYQITHEFILTLAEVTLESKVQKGRSLYIDPSRFPVSLPAFVEGRRVVKVSPVGTDFGLALL